MATYLISRGRTTNPDLMKEYALRSGPIAQRFGAEYVLRTNKIEAVEGGYEGERLVIARFADRKTFDAFWNSPEYQEARKLRHAAWTGDVWVAED